MTSTQFPFLNLIISIIILLVIVLFIIYWNLMKFARLIFSQYQVIYENKENSVILTIDDAPYYGTSFEKILDLLDQYPACKVTFFFISSFHNELNTPLLHRAIKSGHHLANHGKHDQMHAKCNKSQLIDEIESCQKALEKIYQDAGIPMPSVKYYRPGSGFVNDIIWKYCQEKNYQIVLGSNYCSDPHIHHPGLNEFYIWQHLRPNDIIILHDRPWTVPLLQKLFAKGLKTTSLLEVDKKPKSS